MVSKSFFKDGKSFEEFCRKPKDERERILAGGPADTKEVDDILEEVKKKAEVIKHDSRKGNKSKSRKAKAKVH